MKLNKAFLIDACKISVNQDFEKQTAYESTIERILLYLPVFIITYITEPMKYRKLGKTNWDISKTGYGMWGMGS